MAFCYMLSFGGLTHTLPGLASFGERKVKKFDAARMGVS